MITHDEDLVSLDELRSVLNTHAGPPSPRRRAAPHRLRRPLVLALAVVAAAATAAAAWAILGSSAQETTSIECVIAGTDTIIPSSSGDPAADCAAQWQRDEGTPAPRLIAYETASAASPSSRTARSRRCAGSRFYRRTSR